MDRLVDHLFVFEGDGVIRDFPGNYSLYRLEQKKNNEETARPFETSGTMESKDHTVEASRKKQLSYKEKREFESLEKEIATLSSEKEMINRKLNSGSIPYDELEKLSHRIGEVTRLLDEKELRWLELSEV
jgi:ATP-binding cassette subfamily F protein uup